MSAAVDAQAASDANQRQAADVARHVQAQRATAIEAQRYAERLAALLADPAPLPVAELQQLTADQQRIVSELLERGAALHSELGALAKNAAALVETELVALRRALADANAARARAEDAFAARLVGTRQRLGVVARGRRAMGGYAGALAHGASERGLINRTR